MVGIDRVGEVGEEKSVWGWKKKVGEDGRLEGVFDELGRLVDGKGV